MRVQKRLATLLAATLVFTACGDGDGDGDAAGGVGGAGGEPITMARATWDTGFMQAAIYAALLEELGYEVSDPADLTRDANGFYPALARGEIDLWANGWFPLHDRYLTGTLVTGQTYERAIEPVGTQVDNGALQGYLIDKETADDLGITSMSDLADPATAAVFDDDGDGKADLIGCNEGWGCNLAITDHILVLDWGGNHEQISGDYSELMIDVEQKVADGEPVLFYTWTPNWTVARLVPGRDVVWLESPALPDTEGDVSVSGLEGCANDPCQLGWVVNDIRAVANADFLDENPSVRRLLEVVEIPLDDIATQNAEMAASDDYSNADIEAAADAWIEANRGLVDGWLQAARG